MEEDTTLYNQITVKNVDGEDFIFKAGAKRESYMIRAGEIRIFPKFMVRPMLKHLINKILIKRDPEGKLLRNQKMREELAAQIVLKEEVHQRPIVPTDRQLVDDMNPDKPELDKILEKNRSKLKKDEKNLILEPEVDTKKVKISKPKPIDKPRPKIKNPPAKSDKIVEKESKPVDQPVSKTEDTFDQIEEEKDRPLPTREAMLKYAKNTLKVDITEEKTKKAWDAMSDEELYKEFGLDQEPDLKAIGL